MRCPMLWFQLVFRVRCRLYAMELTYGGSGEKEDYPDLRQVIGEVLKRYSSWVLVWLGILIVNRNV